MKDLQDLTDLARVHTPSERMSHAGTCGAFQPGTRSDTSQEGAAKTKKNRGKKHGGDGHELPDDAGAGLYLHSGRDYVKSPRSSYTGLYPQNVGGGPRCHRRERWGSISSYIQPLTRGRDVSYGDIARKKD